MGRTIAHRVLVRLQSAESKESNPHFRDDYRIAWITTMLAARGNPIAHVEATYRVLGLHPDKVWSAHVAMRKAKLGALYHEFFPERASLRSSVSSLPPKKPAQSVALTEEPQRRVVGIQDRGEYAAGKETSSKKQTARNRKFPAAVQHVEKPLNMASTARAYPNPGAPTSGKKPHFFTREEISRLLELADFSAERPANHPRHSRRKYHRDHLNMSLLGMWKAAGSVQGREVLLFADVGNYSIDAKRCERQMRYNLRVLEQSGAIELVYPENKWIRSDYYRRTRTYRLRLDVLRERQRRTSQQIKVDRPIAEPIPPHSISDAPKAAPVTPIAPTAPREHRGTERKLPALTTRQRATLVQAISEFTKGCHGRVATKHGESRWVHEGDPEYRAPMDKDSAILAACEWMCTNHGTSMEKALEAAADAGFRLVAKGDT